MLHCDWCESRTSLKMINTCHGYRAMLCGECQAINAREAREMVGA
jgi:hypothetical protein